MDWVQEFKAALSAEYGERPGVCVLASVDDEGRPAARSVVCRAVEPAGEMVFVSDARSGKNDEFREHPAAAAVFWLAQSRVQYRIDGAVAVIRAGLADELRERVWAGLSDATRATLEA